MWLLRLAQKHTQWYREIGHHCYYFDDNCGRCRADLNISCAVTSRKYFSISPQLKLPLHLEFVATLPGGPSVLMSEWLVYGEL